MSALLGATLAEWQKRREEESARLAAMRNSGGGEEEEDRPRKKTAGQIAYEKKQQQKRIVAESQALMNTRKATQQTQNAIAKNKNLAKAEAEMGKVKPVTPYVVSSYLDKEEETWLKGNESQRAWAAVNAQEDGKKAEQERLNDVNAARWAGLASVAQGRQEEEKKPWWEQIAQTWNETVTTPLLNIWNTTSKQITNAWNFVATPIVNAWNTATRVVKDVSVDVFRFFYNARGEDLVEVSEDEILRSPEIALRKTYIAAAINVQRDGLNLARNGYTSGKGPAQLSQQQLDTPYGEPYYLDDCEEIKAKCIAGYGVGVDGSPYDPDVAVKGMTNRIEQVVKYAENQAEKNDVTLDETDRFIITALSQNGPGFDKDDISNLLANYVSDGTIDWGGYFGDEYEDWTEKPWLKRGYLEAWQWKKTGKGGKDFDTEFSLELYYQEMRALESQGYPFPEGLDIQRIEDLMNTSEQARQEK